MKWASMSDEYMGDWVSGSAGLGWPSSNIWEREWKRRRINRMIIYVYRFIFFNMV